MDTTTSSVESVITDLVWVHRDKLIELASKSFQNTSRTKTLSQPELENWVDGFIVILLEALQQKETSYRRYFQERLVSDLVESGVPPNLLLQLSIAWAVLVSNKFVLLVNPPMQTETTRWFSSFFAVYVSELSAIIQNAPTEANKT
jgi:hypothetical protein